MKKHTKFIMMMLAIVIIVCVGMMAWMHRENAGAVDAQPSTQKDDIAIADIWTSMLCKLDGVVYQLPCTYADFAQNGWEFATHEDDIPGIDERTNEIFRAELKKGDCTIWVQLYHTNSEATAAEECKIIEISVSDNSGVEFEVAKGIDLNSTEKEIEKAFGICETRLNVNSSEFRTIEYYNGTAREGSLVFTYSKQDDGNWIKTIFLHCGYIR